MLDKLIDKVNYPELVKELRETSMYFGESDNVSVMLLEAANAIDDLCEALAEECEEKDYLVREMAKNGQLPKQAWEDFSYGVNFGHWDEECEAKYKQLREELEKRGTQNETR